MKAGLVGKAQAPAGADAGNRSAVGPGDPTEADLVAGFQLALEEVRVRAGRGQEKAVQAPEIAIDAFAPLDLLDAVDRRRLAGIVAARFVEAAQADVLVIKIVELGR